MHDLCLILLHINSIAYISCYIDPFDCIISIDIYLRYAEPKERFEAPLA